MSARKHKGRWEAEQEEIDKAERQAHEDGTCGGMLLCGYCLDDWEEQERLDQQGYYDSKETK